MAAEEHNVTSSAATPEAHRQLAEPRHLWFGFAGSAFAWVTLGCFDLVVTWRACIMQEEWGIPPQHTSATVLYLGVSLLLLAVTIYAGVTSYRNWRRFATIPYIVETKAVDRREFMAVAGVLVACTLGAGIVWLALPPLFLDLCWRAR